MNFKKIKTYSTELSAVKNKKKMKNETKMFPFYKADQPYLKEAPTPPGEEGRGNNLHILQSSPDHPATVSHASHLSPVHPFLHTSLISTALPKTTHPTTLQRTIKKVGESRCVKRE